MACPISLSASGVVRIGVAAANELAIECRGHYSIMVLFHGPVIGRVVFNGKPFSKYYVFDEPNSTGIIIRGDYERNDQFVFWDSTQVLAAMPIVVERMNIA